MIQSNNNYSNTYQTDIAHFLIKSCIIFTVLSLFTTVNEVFAIANFLFCIYVILSFNKRYVIPFLIYATFFASLFKVLALSEMSLFTIIMLIFVVKEVISTRQYEARFIIGFLLLMASVIIIELISGYFDLARNIKFFETYLYVYIAVIALSLFDFDEDSGTFYGFDYRPALLAFVSGVLFSSALRLLDGGVFHISNFVTEKVSDLGIGIIEYNRFSGLYNDPNYYAINVILAMCAVVFLYARKDLSWWKSASFIVVLAVFAIMTRSKSAFLMLVVPILLLFNVTRKQKKYAIQIVVLVALLVVVYFAMTGKITWFASITGRFKIDTDFESLTTGRTTLWISYMQYLKDNPIKAIFGSGLSSPILGTRGAHNTYIDILYYLGIIPGALYLFTVINLFRIRKAFFRRSFINYSGIIVVACMYFFISSLFDIDLSTNLILMIIMYNTPIAFGRQYNIAGA